MRLVNPGRIAMVPSTVPVRQEIAGRTVPVSLVNLSRRLPAYDSTDFQNRAFLPPMPLTVISGIG